MTFLSMQQLASDYLDDISNGYFTLTLLKQRINLAAKETQKRLLMTAQEFYVQCVKTSTVNGQAAYALPSDFMQERRLYYITSGSGPTAIEQKIVFITPNQRDLVTDVSGAPVYYYMQNGNLMLKPVPDKVYELHLEYTYEIVDMVADSDTLDMPLQFHEHPVLLTVRDCMVKDNRPLGNIETKLKDYEELFKQFAAERITDGPRMIVSSEDLGW